MNGECRAKCLSTIFEIRSEKEDLAWKSPGSVMNMSYVAHSFFLDVPYREILKLVTPRQIVSLNLFSPLYSNYLLHIYTVTFPCSACVHSYAVFLANTDLNSSHIISYISEDIHKMGFQRSTSFYMKSKTLHEHTT